MGYTNVTLGEYGLGQFKSLLLVALSLSGFSYIATYIYPGSSLKMAL